MKLIIPKTKEEIPFSLDMREKSIAPKKSRPFVAQVLIFTILFSTGAPVYANDTLGEVVELEPQTEVEVVEVAETATVLEETQTIYQPSVLEVEETQEEQNVLNTEEETEEVITQNTEEENIEEPAEETLSIQSGSETVASSTEDILFEEQEQAESVDTETDEVSEAAEEDQENVENAANIENGDVAQVEPGTQQGSGAQTQQGSGSQNQTPSMELAQVNVTKIKEELTQTLRGEIEEELKKGCVVLEEFGYFCPKEKQTETNVYVPRTAYVYATKIGGESDTEILFDDGEKSISLTVNEREDMFPSYDEGTNTAVWQSLVDGRWVIYTRDISLVSEEQRVSDLGENSMNPFREGNYIVWQGWNKNNWDIYVAEHIGGAWSAKRISSTSVHDMFPKVGGGFVTWQSYVDGSWHIFTYNLLTGSTTQVSEGSGTFENPRVAIIWEERESNGDISYVAYDVALKETKKLKHKEKNTSLPEEALPIPGSDPKTVATSTQITIVRERTDDSSE